MLRSNLTFYHCTCTYRHFDKTNITWSCSFWCDLSVSCHSQDRLTLFFEQQPYSPPFPPLFLPLSITFSVFDPVSRFWTTQTTLISVNFPPYSAFSRFGKGATVPSPSAFFSHILRIHPVLAPSTDSLIPRFTCNTAISDSLPILDPLQPNPRRRSYTNTPAFLHKSPPHLEPTDSQHLYPPTVPAFCTLRTLPATLRVPSSSIPHSQMSTRLDIPVLAGVLDVSTVNAWLNLCQDSFEVHAAMNNSTLKPFIQIVLAGIKMEATAARGWWNDNRDELKGLATWDEFAKKVRERFVPANWRMDSLAAFYNISQGPSSFLDFVARLEDGRNSLSAAGTGFTIGDSVFKNHLLFFCHPILSLRIRSISGFNYSSTRIDILIALMLATWESMVAERVICPPFSMIPSTSNLLTSGGPQKPFVPLTDKECEALRLTGGCYRCRRTPSSPGWIKHGSRNCPGDAENGITPAPARVIGAVTSTNSISAALELEEDDEDVGIVAGVFPSCVLGDGSFSEGEEDWD